VKAVSLFAGVGGFDLALQRNGAEIVASVEIDKHARKILEKQFPHTNHLEDVCNVTGEQLFNLGFESSGIIVGGFPCQDLSVAGKRAGLSGKRSGLFYEVARILSETKAQNFVLENVPGLLSSQNGADMAAVIGTLADLGYSVAWRVLDAQYFGVPQRRRRVFIVGNLGDNWRTPAEVLAIAEGRERYLAESANKRQNPSRSTPKSVKDIGKRIGNFELESFSQDGASLTLSRERAHDTFIYEGGK